MNALFLILESGNDNSYLYSAEGISIFYERRERYLKGEGKNFSDEEAFDQLSKFK